MWDGEKRGGGFVVGLWRTVLSVVYVLMGCGVHCVHVGVSGYSLSVGGSVHWVRVISGISVYSLSLVTRSDV